MAEDNDLTDPEDAYDATDPPRERLRNFVRRVQWLADHIDEHDLRLRVLRLRDDLNTLRDETED